jgi:hypothetical protein
MKANFYLTASARHGLCGDLPEWKTVERVSRVDQAAICRSA